MITPEEVAADIDVLLKSMGGLRDAVLKFSEKSDQSTLQSTGDAKADLERMRTTINEMIRRMNAVAAVDIPEVPSNLDAIPRSVEEASEALAELGGRVDGAELATQEGVPEHRHPVLKEAERFDAEITSNQGDGLYGFREVLLDDSDPKEWATFTAARVSSAGNYAREKNLNANVANGTFVEIVDIRGSDGRATYSFFFNPRAIAFSGICMISAYMPDTPDAGTDTMANSADVSSGDGVPGGDEQRLLLKLATPIKAGQEFTIFMPLDHLVAWVYGAMAGADTSSDMVLRAELVTEDFDVAGGSCATWDTQPASTLGGLLPSAPTYGNGQQYVNVTVNPADMNGFTAGFDSSLGGGTAKAMAVTIGPASHASDIYGLKVLVERYAIDPAAAGSEATSTTIVPYDEAGAALW